MHVDPVSFSVVAGRLYIDEGFYSNNLMESFNFNYLLYHLDS